MNTAQFDVDLATLSLEDLMGFQDSSEESAGSGREDSFEDVTPHGGVEWSGQVGTTDLPEELMKNVVRLSTDSMVAGGVCRVYLVGTAHISQDSCREVEAIIRFLKPQVVFLELCSRRIVVLSPCVAKEPTMAEVVDMWKKRRNIVRTLLSLYMDKLAAKLEVAPGSEFRVAYEEANKYGSRVVLGDRPIEITFARTWRKMSVWYKAKFVWYLLTQWMRPPKPEELEKMMKEFDDKDVVTLAIEELSKAFPAIVETLIHERDQYMSSKLVELAKENSSIVAVVGKGHLHGISQNWEKPIEIQKLLEVPLQKKRGIKVKLWRSLGIAAVAGLAIASGIYLSTKK